MLKKRKWMAGLMFILTLLLSTSLFIGIANAAEKKIRIAIMPLDMSHIKPWWTTELVNTGKFTVIERSELQKVLDEQELGKKGVLDPATAARVGKVLGVQLFILGTVTEFSLDTQKVSLPILGKS